MTTKLKIGSVEEVMATRARATFSHRVNFDAIKYKHLDVMKSWCTDNCQGLWRAETVHALYFQFENERDAFLFMLKWGAADGNKLS